MSSVTSDYISGALACFCDCLGSTELDGDTYGRQCQCPQTAICNNCGASFCPINVEGKNCDHCKPKTFNFDVQPGRDDCNCNRLGVIDNRMQFEADNTNGAYRKKVIGRTYDHIVPGHFTFLECLPCTCDSDGTTDDMSDQATAQCYCKKYVTGQIIGMSDWSVVNVDTNGTLSISPWTLPLLKVNDSVITVHLVDDDADQKVVYFGAPDYYLGQRLTSYGGYLTYTILYLAAEDSRAIAAADVIIGGINGFIVHNSIEQPTAQLSWTHAVKLIEDEFTNLDGSPVCRDQFMNTLVNIESMYIRATYEDKSLETSLIAVTLDIEVKSYAESENAYRRRDSLVEQCQCEQCAEGSSPQRLNHSATDQATAQCHCKKYVVGQIIGMSDWSVVNVDTNGTLSISPWTLPLLKVNDSVITVHLVDDDADQKVVYFGAPDYYLGQRLTSYGGYLTYTILYLAAEDSHAIAAADVIIGGINGFIVHNSIEQPPAQISWTHAVKLMEEEFTNLDGSPVCRDQFMNTLVNIESIYIRATYEDKSLETSLIQVTLDIGVESYNESEDAYLRRESSVEQCECEQCAEGYYRLNSGFCVPCQSDGHSEDCYVNIGECMECTDCTMGGHCEMRVPEYHGDETLPFVSNNFATSCVLTDDGAMTSCQCNCAFNTTGYYGVPYDKAYGMDHCVPSTSTCVCCPGVIGCQCEQCAPNHWTQSSGQGCTPCCCVLASQSEQSDSDTEVEILSKPCQETQ